MYREPAVAVSRSLDNAEPGAVVHTLMVDLEDGPEHFVLLLPFMRSVLRILHLVCEVEQCVLDIFEAFRRRLPVPCAADGRHGEGSEAWSLGCGEGEERSAAQQQEGI